MYSLPMATYWRHPREALKGLRLRWPSPAQATARVGGPFNELPRLPFQLAECFRRTANFLLKPLAFRQHKLRVALIALGTLLLLGLVLYQPLLRELGHVLYYENAAFERADAVIVPSGILPGRALQAADLLLQSRADEAILFHEVLPERYRPRDRMGADFREDHEINRDILLRQGVDENRVLVLPGGVKSTWEEAQALKHYLVEHPMESIVISTCRFHSYRAYLNFEKALEGTGVKIYSVPSKYCRYDPNSWWQSRFGTQMLRAELAKLIAFFLGRQ